MPSILDAFQYPFHEPVAQQLHAVLTQLYPTPQGALLVSQRAGIDTSFINFQQAPAFLWAAVLEMAAQSGLTRELVRQVHDLVNPNSPRRPFLDDLLADRKPPTEGEPRSADGCADVPPGGTDDVSEPEGPLLYHDDLTIAIGRAPGLIMTLQRLVELAPAVCKLAVDVHALKKEGTAFRVGPDRLLTNWHVLHAEDGTGCDRCDRRVWLRGRWPRRRARVPGKSPAT